MVTRILFDPRRDLPDGSTQSNPVTIEATPTGIREDGQVVIYPTTVTFTISTAADVFQLPANTASNGWRITARDAVTTAIRQQRVVRVPDQASIAYQALPEIDPASLQINPGTARQWDATFWAFTQLLDNLTVGGGGSGSSGTQYTQAVAAATWTVPHAFGRRPGIELYTLAGERIFTDVVADITQVVVTFPSPQTGYVVLN